MRLCLEGLEVPPDKDESSKASLSISDSFAVSGRIVGAGSYDKKSIQCTLCYPRPTSMEYIAGHTNYEIPILLLVHGRSLGRLPSVSTTVDLAPAL